MNLIKFDDPDSLFTALDFLLAQKYTNLVLERYGELDKKSKNDDSLRKYIFSTEELVDISNTLDENLLVRLYHGCVIENIADYKKHGLRSLSSEEIEQNLISIAAKDEVLKNYLPKIKEKLFDELFINRLRLSRGPKDIVCFCPTKEISMTKGSRYVRYGSEHRFRILDSIDEDLKNRIQYHGKSAILVFDIPLKLLNQKFRINNFIDDWCNKVLKLYSYSKYDGEFNVSGTVPWNLLHEIIYTENL